MAAIVSQNIFDSSNLLFVPVVASFDSTGQIKPLYVRINGNPLEILSAKEKPAFMSTRVFQCVVGDHGIEKPLSLTYHCREGAWSTPAFDSGY